MSDTVSRPRPWRRTVVLLLLAAVLATIGWRVDGIVRKGFPQHDEVVSYLHASGKAVAYSDMVNSGSAPYGSWAPASAWQDYIHPDGSPWGKIAQGLGRSDVAPPLYYWVLSLWERVFGPGPASGLWLNLVFALGTLGAIFGFAREILRDDAHAALVCLVWAVMPPAIDVSLMSRQYDLLALATMALLWSVARLTDPARSPRIADAAFVAAAALVGSLTQHLFVVSLVAAFLMALVRSWRTRRATLLWAGGSMAAGWLLNLAFNPYIWQQLAKQSGREGALTGVGPLTIVRRVIDTLAAAFGLSPRVGELLGRLLHGASPSLAVLGVIAVAAFIALIVPRGRRGLKAVGAGLAGQGALEWAISIGVIGTVTLVTVLSAKGVGVVPSRYLAVLWPLLAFVPVLIARGFPARTVAIVLVFVALLMAADYVTYARGPKPPDPHAVFAGARHVVLDDPARGIVLRYMWMIPPTAATYVAWRGDLMRDTRWTDRLVAGDVIVLSDPYQPTEVDTSAVLNLLGVTWTLRRIGRTAVPGLVYRLEPKVAVPSGP